MLEAALYKSSTFCTLTYATPHLPKDGVSREHFENFLKLLRFHLSPLKLRYYGCAEYGELNGRPHYHAVLFGLPANKATLTLIEACWKFGFVEISELNIKRARYIAKYVIKKLTRINDERLCGLNPEFPSTSRALGVGMVQHIAETIDRYDLYLPNGDIPYVVEHGGKPYPLGRFLRQKIRLLVSGAQAELDALPRNAVLRRARILRRSSIKALPDQRREIEMQIVRHLARTDKENPSQKSQLQKISANEIAHVERRYRQFNRKGQL